MATTATPRSAALGGSFLLDAPRLESVFTPADLSDDQRLIGQTAEEFVAHEVLPRIPELELHKESPSGPGESAWYSISMAYSSAAAASALVWSTLRPR